MHDGDDLDPLAAGIYSQDGNGTGQICVTSSRPISSGGRAGPRGRLARLRRGVVDFGGHRGEQRRDRGFLGDGFGDHVDGARLGRKAGISKPSPGPGSTEAASAGSAMNEGPGT